MKAKPTLDFYTCTQCGLTKQAVDFPLGKVRKKDGSRARIARCGPCEFQRTETWRKNNLEHRAAKIKSLRKKHPLRDNQYYRKARYGLTKEAFDKMLENQDGCCAICKNPEPRGAIDQRSGFHIDHCHETGKVRGILCNACNTGIGHLRDNPDIIEAAAKYLRDFRYNQQSAQTGLSGSYLNQNSHTQ